MYFNKVKQSKELFPTFEIMIRWKLCYTPIILGWVGGWCGMLILWHDRLIQESKRKKITGQIILNKRSFFWFLIHWKLIEIVIFYQDFIQPPIVDVAVVVAIYGNNSSIHIRTCYTPLLLTFLLWSSQKTSTVITFADVIVTNEFLDFPTSMWMFCNAGM